MIIFIMMLGITVLTLLSISLAKESDSARPSAWALRSQIVME